MKWKICNHCNQAQPLNWYAKNGGNTDGHLGVCLECDRKIKQVWYILNRRREQKKRMRWQAENRELHIFHVAKYMRTDKGKIMQRKYINRITGG